jgi:hypothetical protein
VTSERIVMTHGNGLFQKHSLINTCLSTDLSNFDHSFI